MRRRTALVVAVGLLFLSPSASAAAVSDTPNLVLHLRDPSLIESSGLAGSARHDGILWTHNDGGDRAEVVAVDGAGRSVATVRLDHIDPYDPEALATGPDPRGRPALFLGDIGDNRLRRPDISVFRFHEPARLTNRTVPTAWLRFRYPDGAHDAEALLVDPRDGRILVATKDVFGGGLYAASLRPRPGRTAALRRIGDVPSFVTDGAFLPDGRYVLRTYSSVCLYDRDHRLLAKAPLPLQRQGESIAVRGNELLVGSEGKHSAIYAVPIPPAPADRQATDAGQATTPPASVSKEVDTRSLLTVAGGATVAGLLVLLGAGAWWRRRRPR